MKKRILPILLVLVMLLSLLPAQVFAASYTFDPNATIFTQNYTTETHRPNNLGDYFTVTSTPLSTADKTTTWNTGNNGTSVAVFNKDGSKLYGDTHAILTFTFKKNCNFWFKHLFSISSGSPYSYAELRLNGTAIAKGTSSDKLASPYNVDVKAGDIFEIDFYSEEDFMTPCAMTLKNIRCTDPVSSDVTVTFDANGGEGTMAAQTLTEGKGTLTANAFTKEGFRFAGWALSAAGEKVYADGAAVELTADTTLYALWEAEQASLSVHFDGNGYTQTINDKTVVPGKVYTNLPYLAERYMPTDKRLESWYIKLDGEGDARFGAAVTKDTDFSTMGDEVTLIAKWRGYQYIIKYNIKYSDKSSVTGTMADQPAPFGENVKLNSCAYSRPGYDFAGWATSSYGSTIAYADGATIKRDWEEDDWGDGSEDNEPFNLYAVWTEAKSEEEKEADAKLTAAEKAISGTYLPTYGKDANALTMIQAKLTAAGITDVAVSVKAGEKDS